MGNSPSSPGGGAGSLSLVLDPPSCSSSGSSGSGYHAAGTVLRGSVYLQSKSAVPPGAPLNLTAYLTGKERSRVRYEETEWYTDRDGRRQTRRVTRYRYAERRIVQVSMDLNLRDASKDGVQAGDRYRFPFEIVLPTDLPSSMSTSESRGGVMLQYGGGVKNMGTGIGAGLGAGVGDLHGFAGYGGRGCCEVSYKVKAELKGGGMFGTVRQQQQIRIVAAPLPKEPLPHLVSPVTHKVKAFGCVGAGSMTLGARVENTRVGWGESAAIDFACKNESRRGIDRVEAQIVEETTWEAAQRRNYSRRVLAKQTFHPTQRWQKLSKEEMKDIKVRTKGQTASFVSDRERLLQEIHRAVHDGDNRALVNLPSSALGTYHGSLISVRHRLQIKVFTRGICVDNPTVEINLFVGTPSKVVGEGKAAATATATAPSAPPAEWSDIDGAAPVVIAAPATVVSGGLVGGAAAAATATEVDGQGPEDDDGNEHEVVFETEKIPPLLSNLLKEIEYAVSPISAVREHLDDSEWQARVFDIMTPPQYSSVIKAVAIEFDQPEMAAALAPHVRGGNFTYEYVIAALRAVSEWLRVGIVQKLLPHCTGLSKNSEKIKAELSNWEIVCTEKDFEDALRL